MKQIDCDSLIASYSEWLNSGFTGHELPSGCRITTPFLDRHNDFLQIYVEALPDGAIQLSDDGFVMRDLQISGFELEGERRQEALETILRSFSVQLEGDELVVTTREVDFPLKKHDLIQAMLAVSDLVLLAQPTVVSLFLEDVANYFEAHQVRASQGMKITGVSGLDHSFDFVIAKSNGRPERLVNTIATPSRASVIETIFAWDDVRANRPDSALAFAFVNDTTRGVRQEHLDALLSYEIHPIVWSEREAHIEQLR